ncbi:SDR family NAD(P)-dependent oxidoreductase [Saccharopolyspora sp. 5N708]|uniref:SDR family NAD(P)-dependent oxidoreductase n=1 Tax=Saccharopolyspora sp. 5N708 TaxID=3457424 RepID=UPI003FD47AEF
MDLQLKDSAVIVTGGSRGIGLETARLFAAEGARVLICARRPEALAEAADDIEQTTGARPETAQVDVTDPTALDRLVETALDRLGGIDVLVNNAGTGTYKPFLEVTDEELQHGMAINFFAQFRLCQRVIPHLIAKGGGSIVNVAGETGIRVTPPPFRSSCTGPAKSAEIRLSKVLASEFGAQGVRVNCVVPGLVHTPDRFAKWEREMVKDELSETEAEQVRRAWGSNIANADNGWGTPEELARLIVFAASKAVPFINGAVLVADGAEDKS